MNQFDANILHFLNQFARRSLALDDLNSMISASHVALAVPVVAIFWWAWFRDEGEDNEDRRIIVSSIFLCTASIFIARVLAISLPYRERPLRNPLLQFRVPFGISPDHLIQWSSFPSDHAIFLFCMAMSAFFLSRKWGGIALTYVFLICVSRVYSGIHYPTDILVGALLGAGIACLSLIKGFRDRISSKPIRWAERSPTSFYPCFYLVTFLFGTMFESLREVASTAWIISYHLTHH